MYSYNGLDISVAVANNGHDFVDDSISSPSSTSISSTTYTYVSPLSVSHISPKSGAVEGGTVIFIHGNHFIKVGEKLLQCRFGNGNAVSVVPGIYLSKTVVRCITPLHSKGRVPVEISTNGVDFTNNGVQFEYQVQAYITSVNPSFGPITGGTKDEFFPLVWKSVCPYKYASMPFW